MNEKWPDPTPEMLDDPLFNRIWNVVKSWDINVPHAYEGYCEATGNHARAIYDAVSTHIHTLKQMNDEMSEKIENAHIAACETQPSWGWRMARIMGALGLDFGDPETIDADINAKAEKWKDRALLGEKILSDLIDHTIDCEKELDEFHGLDEHTSSGMSDPLCAAYEHRGRIANIRPSVIFDRNAMSDSDDKTTHADTIQELQQKIEALEALRPHWAKGYTSDGVAAQCATDALIALWKILDVQNQTAAVAKLTQMMRDSDHMKDAVEVLREVWSWIDGWSPNFIYDEEWSVTRERIRTVLKTKEG